MINDSIVICCFAIVILSVIGGLFSVRQAAACPPTAYRTLPVADKRLSRIIDCIGNGEDMSWAPYRMLTSSQNSHHSMMGSRDDPEDGPAVAAAVFGAVGVYGVFLVFCASQAWLNMRENRRGDIRLS